MLFLFEVLVFQPLILSPVGLHEQVKAVAVEPFFLLGLGFSVAGFGSEHRGVLFQGGLADTPNCPPKYPELQYTASDASRR